MENTNGATVTGTTETKAEIKARIDALRDERFDVATRANRTGGLEYIRLADREAAILAELFPLLTRFDAMA